MMLVNLFSLGSDGLPGCYRHVYEHDGRTIYIDRDWHQNVVDVFVVRPATEKSACTSLYCVVSWDSSSKVRRAWRELESEVEELLTERNT